MTRKQCTQTQRVIAAARSYRGITAVDFMLPNVVDGGAPITRVAARLWDAERDGFSFECLGKRDRCKVFRLCGEPDVEGSDGGSGGGVRSIPSSSDRSPVAALDAGVERDGSSSDLPPDARRSFVAPAAVSLSAGSSETSGDLSGRLFEVEPERPHHYEGDIAA